MISLLRSFSFRAGFLIFCAISAMVMVLRLAEFSHLEDGYYDEIRLIAGTNLVAIDEVMEQEGSTGVISLLRHLEQQAHDEHLHIGYQTPHGSFGDVDMQGIAHRSQQWQRQAVAIKNTKRRLPLYFQTRHYADGSLLAVGYDLEKINHLHEWLWQGLLEFLALSLALSLGISAVLVWLLNRHLQRLNQSFNTVMRGDLTCRLPVGRVVDQFDGLAANFNQMMDWILALVHSVQDSSNALAHDLRTPLSRHRLELRGILEHRRLPAEVKESLGKSIEQIDKLVDMFENILRIEHAEARSATEVFSTFNLTDLIKDLIEFYEPLVETQNQRLAFRVPLTPVQLKGDKQLLGQAILNLIDNAVKYAGNGAMIRVTLTAADDDSAVSVSVEDNGPGIPTEMLERVKGRFIRLDESRHTSGSGLGLSLVEATAKLHRGELLLERTEPGLRVTLRLQR